MNLPKYNLQWMIAQNKKQAETLDAIRLNTDNRYMNAKVFPGSTCIQDERDYRTSLTPSPFEHLRQESLRRSDGSIAQH
jgi:hypothetical protein